MHRNNAIMFLMLHFVIHLIKKPVENENRVTRRFKMYVHEGDSSTTNIPNCRKVSDVYRGGRDRGDFKDIWRRMSFTSRVQLLINVFC